MAATAPPMRAMGEKLTALPALPGAVVVAAGELLVVLAAGVDCVLEADVEELDSLVEEEEAPEVEAEEAAVELEAPVVEAAVLEAAEVEEPVPVYWNFWE